MSSIFSIFKSKNDNKKLNAVTPKVNSQQEPAITTSTNKDASMLQQSLGNQAIAKRAQQTDPSTKQDTSTPEQETDLFIEDQEVDSIYTKKLYEPLRLALLLEFGVGIGQWRRSDELNEFRQGLKDAARAQSSENIANLAPKHKELQGKGKIGQAFFSMIANKEAYSLSKVSVNTIMEGEAERIMNTIIPAASAKQQLKLAAHNAAYQLAKLKQNATDKLRKAALTGAQTKAIQLLGLTKSIAVNHARKIVIGDQSDKKDSPNKEHQNDLTSAVKTQVTTDKIADKAINLALESDSLNSGLTNIGGVIDLAVPNDGDSAALALELRIPLGQFGGYVNITFGAEAERDDGDLKVSTQIGIGIGLKKGLDLNYQFGLYLEAQAGNSTSVMNLISYGMYRHMNIILPSAAESIWGQSGKSGMSELEEAEIWASAIEAQDMKGENYVDVGTFHQLSAEFKAGIAEVSLSAGKKKLTHFDQETINEKTGNSFGDDTKLKQLRAKAAHLSNLEQKKVYEASGEVGLDLGFGSLNLSAEGSHTRFEGKPESIEISIGASIPFQYGEDAAKWVTYMSKIATPALGLLTKISTALTRNKDDSQDDHNTSLRNEATKLDIASDAMILLPQFDGIGNSLAEQIQELNVDTGELENKIAVQSSTNLTLNFERKWDDTGKLGDWKLSVELGQTKSIEVDAGFLKFSVEKTKKIAEFGREKKKGQKKFIGSFLGS